MSRSTSSSTRLERLNPRPVIAPISTPSHRVIAFIGGSGGVGASVIASAAAYLSRDSVLLLDLDPGGGGIDLLLAAESIPGQRWHELQHVRGALEPGALRPVAAPSGVHVVSHSREYLPVASEAMCSVITAARAQYSLVILDLPRDFSDKAVLALIDQILIVVGGDVRACASANSNVLRLQKIHSQISAVVRTSEDAVGIAEFLGIPLAAEVLWEPRLSHDIDNGITPGSRKRGQVFVGVEQLLAVLCSQIPTKRRRLVS